MIKVLEFSEEGLDFEVDTVDADNLFWLKAGKGDSVHNQCFFTLSCEKTAIYHFSFTALPGCCGVVVCTNAYKTGTGPSYKNLVYKKAFQMSKDLLAKYLGYTVVIATADMSVPASAKNMFNSKYKIVETFNNKRTGNPIGIGIKIL